MAWFREQWQSLQRSAGQWTGMGALFRGTQNQLQQHAAYIKIGLVFLAFALSLWLIWSVVFHFAQTFVMLRQIHALVGWLFVLVVVASISWLVWFVRSTLRDIQHAKQKAKHRLAEEKSEPQADPTAAFLSSLPKPPDIGLADLLQPGARSLMEALLAARDPASYEKALEHLDRQEKREGRAPEWMLARAQILLHIGRSPQAYRLFEEIRVRYPKTRYAKDASLLDLAARIEFAQESIRVESPVTAPTPQGHAPPHPTEVDVAETYTSMDELQPVDAIPSDEALLNFPTHPDPSESVPDILPAPATDPETALPTDPQAPSPPSPLMAPPALAERTPSHLASLRSPTARIAEEPSQQALEQMGLSIAFDPPSSDRNTMVKASPLLRLDEMEAMITPPSHDRHTLVKRSPLVELEQLEAMLAPPSSEESVLHYNAAQLRAHIESPSSSPPKVQPSSVPKAPSVASFLPASPDQSGSLSPLDIEAALAALPPAYHAQEEAHLAQAPPSLQTAVRFMPSLLDKEQLDEMLRPPSNDQEPSAQPPMAHPKRRRAGLFDEAQATHLTFEEEDLSHHVPLLEEGLSSDERHALEDVLQMLEARATPEGVDPAFAFAKAQAEAEAWFAKHPPILGGIALDEAKRYEAILEEADRLREAGERQRAHTLLHDLLRMLPESRYAKDAEMRLVSDQLFVVLSEK